MNNDKIETYKFFVYGLSGSGKDTISNILKNVYGFVKLRIAGTIKQIICEQENINFSELDIIKRKNPALRTMHNDVGKFMDNKNGTITRIKQLISLDSVDCDIIPNIDESNIIICDVRNANEAKIFLNAGYMGIFLSRVGSEFRDLTHHTEQDMFSNGDLLKLIEEYNNGKNIVIILNNDKENNSVFVDKLIKLNTNCNVKIITTNGSVERLRYMFQEFIENDINNINKC